LKQVAVTIGLPSARRLAFGVVLGQAAVTLVAALASGLIGGTDDAVSALLGGGIGTVASLAMAIIAFGGRVPRSGPQVLAFFFLGELAKLALMIGLFIAAWHWMRPSPLAMLAAYGATFLVYWIALANAVRHGSGAMQHLDKKGVA
jgi:F0F1-type ATP synthase assembly protein I